MKIRTDKRGLPTHYMCVCQGCMVTAETWYRMHPCDGGDGPGTLRCPECNGTYANFEPCDPPTTNEQYVDSADDLQTHAQGEDEGRTA